MPSASHRGSRRPSRRGIPPPRSFSPSLSMGARHRLSSTGSTRSATPSASELDQPTALRVDDRGDRRRLVPVAGRRPPLSPRRSQHDLVPGHHVTGRRPRLVGPAGEADDGADLGPGIVRDRPADRGRQRHDHVIRPVRGHVEARQANLPDHDAVDQDVHRAPQPGRAPDVLAVGQPQRDAPPAARVRPTRSTGPARVVAIGRCTQRSSSTAGWATRSEAISPSATKLPSLGVSPNCPP